MKNRAVKNKGWLVFQICFLVLMIVMLASISINREARGTSLSDGALYLIVYATAMAGMLIYGFVWIRIKEARVLLRLRQRLNLDDNSDLPDYLQIPKEYQDEQAVKQTKLAVAGIALFVFVSSLILAFSFIGMFKLQNSATGFIGKIVSTGIHIPVVLVIVGFLIKGVQTITVKRLLTPNHSKKITFMISLALNACMIVVDWRLGLFILAIIAGREIWLDSVFDRGKIKRTINEIRDNDGNPVLYMTSWFCMTTLVCFFFLMPFFVPLQ